MASVTQRIKEIKQPYGGFLKPSEFKKIQFEDNVNLKEENIHSSLVGLTVDYMTRYVMGTPAKEAFKISLMGAKMIDDSAYSLELLKNITGFDSKSIYNACKLVGYDVCYRAGVKGYKDVRTINADDNTINNIKIMIDRSIKFFEKYGPVIKDGFTFWGGYTRTIDSGDGDFLTSDTLWDFKVSSTLPTSSHTLQLLIYYIMGKHSVHSEFDNINKLGIFNPRLNCVFVQDVEKIPSDTIELVSEEIIGYGNKSKNLSYDNELTIAEIMKELKCTRYMVMKYYSEKNLPLKKVNNKYYISRTELYEWIIKMEKERKKQQVIVCVASLLCIVVFMIALLLLF